MGFSVGNTVSPRGQAAPVMVVQSVDNVLGNAICNWTVSGTIQTGLFPFENLQMAGVPPAVNLAAQSGLKMPYDPANATNSSTGGVQQTF
jgi:hypothetical protein